MIIKASKPLSKTSRRSRTTKIQGMSFGSAQYVVIVQYPIEEEKGGSA